MKIAACSLACRFGSETDVTRLEEPICLCHHLLLKSLILAEQLLENQSSTLLACANLINQDLGANVPVSIQRLALLSSLTS